jgi:tripartite-type tricarboxylate transporter receptor subunit TctC
LEEFPEIDPDLLLSGQADAVVLPLGEIRAHPEAGRLKVVAVLINEEPPCAEGCSNLGAERLETGLNPLLAFYLPAKVGWRVRSKLSEALNRSLRRPELRPWMEEACLAPYLEDLDGVNVVLSKEYAAQEALLRATGLLTPLPLQTGKH